MRITVLAASLVLASALCLPLHAQAPLPGVAPVAAQVPAHGVVGITDEAMLSPDYWTAPMAAPNQVLLDTSAIRAQNRRLFELDPSMHDLGKLPARLDGRQVRKWLDGASSRPTTPRWDVEGHEVAVASIDAMFANTAVDAVPADQPTRYGLVVHRTDMRGLPTTMRIFSSRGDTDIDRLQESALFPGTPVVIAHESADGEWLFVISPRYAAWVDKHHIAEGSRAQVLGYTTEPPYRIITGGVEHTVFTREEPRVSQLQLDMGIRLPLADVAPDKPVNGQHPYAAYVLEMPVRNEDGSLAMSPALLPRRADSAADYLPLTPANLVDQGFKFLGERYGWGHAYGTRDCSGFVSEIYRSMGVELPRNTSAQAVSPALEHITFERSDDAAKRKAAVAALQVGDLVYIPGHVMMVIGHHGGMTYLIHDTHGGRYKGADGELVSMALNGVVVTPLEPMMFNETESYIDRMTSIVRPHGALRLPSH
ncbi:SH3 domain-containing protein [Lysobacter sp. H21R4]|uniref:C40 family peptidase n=1 Tax=Lysobacter sp. H21R4 TaxID=2781021 RepID=UPI001887517B|nr:SH3 domain-containing protein [Lysobacter sp. H21R4]QOY63847.1 SH3 domain-containing protein [Lysobacter sp. H21R4]